MNGGSKPPSDYQVKIRGSLEIFDIRRLHQKFIVD